MLQLLLLQHLLCLCTGCLLLVTALRLLHRLVLRLLLVFRLCGSWW
jgi:hypothetical protein